MYVCVSLCSMRICMCVCVHVCVYVQPLHVRHHARPRGQRQKPQPLCEQAHDPAGESIQGGKMTQETCTQALWEHRGEGEEGGHGRFWKKQH